MPTHSSMKNAGGRSLGSRIQADLHTNRGTIGKKLRWGGGGGGGQSGDLNPADFLQGSAEHPRTGHYVKYSYTIVASYMLEGEL